MPHEAVPMLPLLAVLALVCCASAATHNIDTSMTRGDLLTIVQGLGPGDTVVFGPGTYNGLDFVLSDDGTPSGNAISGSAGNPITFTSNWAGVEANRPHILSDTTANSQSLGTFNIMTDAQYITIEGLHLSHSTTGAEAAMSCGFRVWGAVWFERGASNIIIRDCEIDSITGTAIQMNKATDASKTSFVTIENNHIHNLGTATGCGGNGGYVIWGGRASAGTTVIMSDVTIRNNVMHDTGGVDSYAISFDYGWIRSSITDNVIYNAPRGVGTGVRYAVLFQLDNDIVTQESDMVIFSRNIVAHSHEAIAGHTNVGVLVTPGVACNNNLIYDSWSGISIRKNGWTNYRFCHVNYNTLFNGVSPGSTGVFSLNQMTTADQATFIVKNNAVYSNCGACADAFGYRWVGTQSASMQASNNWFQGRSWTEAPTSVWAEFTNPDPSVYFNNPSGTFGAGADFLPLSSLVSGGVPVNSVSVDFDGNSRPLSTPSVGCYQSGASPHSSATLTFKTTGTLVPTIASGSNSPSASPSKLPSVAPTAAPTAASNSPSNSPSSAPSVAAVSSTPTVTPTATPTAAPSATPTAVPTVAAGSPTQSPSSAAPSGSPSSAPTVIPATKAPSSSPSASPTSAGASPTKSPSTSPTSAGASPTTKTPSRSPSASPSVAVGSPSKAPTGSHVSCTSGVCSCGSAATCECLGSVTQCLCQNSQMCLCSQTQQCFGGNAASVSAPSSTPVVCENAIQCTDQGAAPTQSSRGASLSASALHLVLLAIVIASATLRP